MCHTLLGSWSLDRDDPRFNHPSFTQLLLLRLLQDLLLLNTFTTLSSIPQVSHVFVWLPLQRMMLQRLEILSRQSATSRARLLDHQAFLLRVLVWPFLLVPLSLCDSRGSYGSKGRRWESPASDSDSDKPSMTGAFLLSGTSNMCRFFSRAY